MSKAYPHQQVKKLTSGKKRSARFLPHRTANTPVKTHPSKSTQTEQKTSKSPLSKNRKNTKTKTKKAKKQEKKRTHKSENVSEKCDSSRLSEHVNLDANSTCSNISKNAQLVNEIHAVNPTSQHVDANNITNSSVNQKNRFSGESYNRSTRKSSRTEMEFS